MMLYSVEDKKLAASANAKDKIGIVPDGVVPFCCYSFFFDDEDISDYVNIKLYENKECWLKVAENATLQEAEEQHLPRFVSRI